MHEDLQGGDFRHGRERLMNFAMSSAQGSIKIFYSGRRVTDSVELARLEKFLRRLDEMEAIA